MYGGRCGHTNKNNIYKLLSKSDRTLSLIIVIRERTFKTFIKHIDLGGTFCQKTLNLKKPTSNRLLVTG